MYTPNFTEQHTASMTDVVTLIVNNSSGSERGYEVKTKWVGKALAVHRPLKNSQTGETYKIRCYWAITHIETGFSAAVLSRPLTEVLELAKTWDHAFTEIHAPEDTKEWELKDEWRYQSSGSSPICDPYSLEGVAQRYKLNRTNP